MSLELLRPRLAAYLARPVERLTELAGGWDSALYGFTADEDLVLKAYPRTADGRAHAEREWLALNRLRAVGYPVPRGVRFEPDGAYLGFPFVVMEHVPGRPFQDVAEAADPDGRARLTELFTARLVALHDLDPVLLGRAPEEPYIERELDGLGRDTAGSPLAAVVPWLRDRAPDGACERLSIQHRDYHPWNVLVDESGQLWVLDWDWRIGDPRFDLAWTCTLLQRSDLGPVSDAVRDGYARLSGRPLDGYAYFEVLTTLRWLANVLPAAATRAGFAEFLVEPVGRARALLRERTGVAV